MEPPDPPPPPVPGAPASAVMVAADAQVDRAASVSAAPQASTATRPDVLRGIVQTVSPARDTLAADLAFAAVTGAAAAAVRPCAGPAVIVEPQAVCIDHGV